MKSQDEERMSTGERVELAKLARLRARVAKNDVEARIATCFAHFEAQLAAKYSEYDQNWATLTAEAEERMKRLDTELARRCQQLGIPEAFRPRLSVGWYGRGENASKERRVELRRVAQSSLEAQSRRAKLEIERAEAEIIGKIVEASLASSAAKALLENLPAVTQLIPELSLHDMEAKLVMPKGYLED